MWWRCSIVFSVVGVAGAIMGSLLGQQIDGKKLVLLFAILMIVVGVLVLRRKDTRGLDAPVSMSVPAISNSEPLNLLFLAGTAFAVGVLSGFFGIGGGFLVVPGLLFATGMPNDLRYRLLATSRRGVWSDDLGDLRPGGSDRLAGRCGIRGWRPGGRDHRHDAGHTFRLPQGNFEPNSQVSFSWWLCTSSTAALRSSACEPWGRRSRSDSSRRSVL